MARTKVTATELTSAGVVPGSGTTIDATLVTNGVTIPCGGHPEKLLIRVENTAGAEKDLTVPASTLSLGAGAATFRQGVGDLTVAVAATTGVKYITDLESSRFVQSHDDTSAATMAKGGHIYLDFETGFTGTLFVYELPQVK
jgi:hypothetical protein